MPATSSRHRAAGAGRTQNQQQLGEHMYPCDGPRNSAALPDLKRALLQFKRVWEVVLMQHVQKHGESAMPPLIGYVSCPRGSCSRTGAAAAAAPSCHET